MNWTSDAERNIFLLAGVCCLLLPPLGITSLGLQHILLLLASHLILLLYCAVCVQRRFAIASSIIIMASLANFLLARFSGLQHADVLIWFFCALALASLPFGLAGLKRSEKLATLALDYGEKDEYRWLLTTAPLLYRWKFLEKFTARRLLG